MRVAPDDSPDAAVAAKAPGETAPERRCILTGAHGPRQQLIRLVPAPDGSVWPDLAARLPGRGAWVTADHALLAAAVAKGKLRQALARSWHMSPPLVPHDLADRIAAGLQQRALQRLGLEMRAGHLIWGSERLSEWARAGRLHLLLHAADAAADGAGRLDQAFRAGDGAMHRVLWLPTDRLALSAALGRDNMVHVGVADPGAAARIEADVARWSGFLQSTQTDGGSGAAAPLLPTVMTREDPGPNEQAQPMAMPEDAPGQDAAGQTNATGHPMAGKTNEGRE